MVPARSPEACIFIFFRFACGVIFGSSTAGSEGEDRSVDSEDWAGQRSDLLWYKLSILHARSPVAAGRRSPPPPPLPMQAVKQRQLYFSPASIDTKWAFSLAVGFFVFVAVAFVTSCNLGGVSWPRGVDTFFTTPFAEEEIVDADDGDAGAPGPAAQVAGAAVARLAYLISGSKGDLERLWRALYATYHPRNVYAVHLDLESPAAERQELARRVAGEPVFAAAGNNVRVITKANLITYRGPTMVSHTLHGCAILLKEFPEWDWFINLSASDYPLVTQDDLLHVFSTKVPRTVNFIEHTSRLEWKARERARPTIVDPALYMASKKEFMWAGLNRELPTAFRLFTGSAWMVLTREFVEYLVWGWDNLPRTLLMYYTNFVSSPEGYFHTVVCNSPDFNATVANHDLHYIYWDNPPKQHPHFLSAADKPRMVASNAPFARKFAQDDPVLADIDAELLGGRPNGSFVAGGWCAGSPPCSAVGDAGMLMPGPGAARLARLIRRLLRPDVFTRAQCK